ncbi:hypothetical protein [Hoeflea olei]|uniref:5-carboxymethyl-2-hydroxymuconate isomerase n=1 Tax=Hoeflea olei TaxID=1480615 RepID=A0A1C1YSB1_9HYPH|nr:hypothetical protein [Hoeflea olei]OCW56336.1 hypothetical protein AWJ14_19795 [Hoeflea olei]
MPNVTIYAPESLLAQPDETYETFLGTCNALCVDLIRAEPDKVHVIFVATGRHAIGRPGYIEVKLRAGGHRTRELMGEFMDKLDAAFRTAFGADVRIRCFAYEGEHIFARN